MWECRSSLYLCAWKCSRLQKRTETSFYPKYLLFILEKAFRACSLFWNQTKMRSYPNRQSIQSLMTPCRQHSYLIYSSPPSPSSSMLSRPTSTITSVGSMLQAARAFLALTSGEMRQLRGILLCCMTPELSVVLRTISGVFMPCDCFPKPQPTLYPNFCIILKAICSFSYGSSCRYCSSQASIGSSGLAVSSQSWSESVYQHWAAKVAAQLFLDSSQLLGNCGSYSIYIFLRVSSLRSSCFSFSTSTERAVVMLIFFAESMLLSLELMLARVNFFLSSLESGGGLVGVRTVVSFLGMGYFCGQTYAWLMELMKLLSFYSSLALSLLAQNFGTGGGLLGLDYILIYIQQQARAIYFYIQGTRKQSLSFKKSQGRSQGELRINPPFQVACFKLMPKAEDVVLQTVHFFYLSGFQVALEVGLVDLVDGQFAQEVFCFADYLLPILSVDIQQAVGLELGFVDEVLVLLVEDEVQHAFGLDFYRAVGVPDFPCSLFVMVLSVELRDDDEGLEGVVEVLLVVVEGRTLNFLCFVPFLGHNSKIRFLWNIHQKLCFCQGDGF